MPASPYTMPNNSPRAAQTLSAKQFPAPYTQTQQQPYPPGSTTKYQQHFQNFTPQGWGCLHFSVRCL